MAESKPTLFALTETPPPREVHVVGAHTRVLRDGSEAFVAEHLRWNRGRTEGKRRARTTPANDPSQLGLFYEEG